ncbi:MAG: Clp protease N-terminal domain-containing protein [Thermoleophilia bacterium]
MARLPGFDIRKIVTLSRTEARNLGSSRIEAEHLLLALASQPQLSAGLLLNSEGLDPTTIRGALDLEFARSLGAVGISLHGFSLPDARLPVLGGLPLGRSAKLALQRAIQARASRGRDRRRMDSLHLLIGILSAEGGTVARALAMIEVDRRALIARARAGLERAA